MRTRSWFTGALALAGALGVLPALTVSAEGAVPERRVVYREWDTKAELSQGTTRGLRIKKGQLRLEEPVGVQGRYEYGDWVSPWVEHGFELTELVPSFSGVTPGNSWVKVEVRGQRGGTTSSWDTLAHWALDDRQVRRTSLDSQTDDLGRVAYDTWLTSGVSSWQLRVTLLRRTGGSAVPKVAGVGAMVSRLPSASSVTTSKPGGDPAALGTVLKVPRYSQMVHRGTYEQYDGGGEAWCSPTSLTMVLDYYDALPPEPEYAWVQQDYPDRVVAHHARMTYDQGLGGTGNWPFNTAYANSRVGDGAGDAFVTRLRHLREAERFIAAGVPLIASVTFAGGELDGAPISSTNGHLLVIVGFRANGDVVVNDPAAPNRRSVRRTYDRDQFEDAWLKRYASGSSMRGSGGLVYVVHDAATPLPDRNTNRNW